MAMTSIPTLHDTKYAPARLGKRTKLTVALAVLFFLLASCRPVHYPQALLVADSLCAAHPQRALEWLDSLRPRMEQERKGVRMYYDLLCIKAQDKAYMPHTSDSLIQAVLATCRKRIIMQAAWPATWVMRRRRWIISARRWRRFPKER